MKRLSEFIPEFIDEFEDFELSEKEQTSIRNFILGVMADYDRPKSNSKYKYKYEYKYKHKYQPDHFDFGISDEELAYNEKECDDV